MRFIVLVLVFGLGLACNQSSDKDPIVRFWSITALQFNDEPVALDSCTSEDYLDVRDDHIMLSYHCEYSKLDSVPSYHIHKLNWKKETDTSYQVYNDDKSMTGIAFIDQQQQLHLILDKKNNRQMKAVFK
ncbi:hypothetical protein [Seonamhaeicola sp.]|uniref:hypothetical protein n=1 Tax=Seonamhaeicola sp. TaxID=1912245 RepID=UPI00260D662A|nr:hypothetical protein [Seonamhaeicola sp.]